MSTTTYVFMEKQEKYSPDTHFYPDLRPCQLPVSVFIIQIRTYVKKL